MNKIMILGSFHFESKLDVMNSNVSHVNENELESVIQSVSNYQPTIVAVEYQRKFQPKLTSDYNHYIATNQYQGNNEVYRLGFEIAKRAGLNCINAIDWMEKGAAERDCGDVIEYINSYEEELHRYMSQFESDAVDLDKESLSLAFRRMNSETECEKSKAFYINIARAGAKDHYGNSWLIWWYQRNLNILSNLFELVKGKDNQRLLLIIGSAHKGILEEFIRDTKDMEIVDSMLYLKQSN